MHAALLAALCACGDDKVDAFATQERYLVDNRRWQRSDAAADPLRDHQPATIDCGLAGWFVEYDLLEVDTGRCNYPLIEHPALIDVPADHTLRTQLIFYDLQADAPAVAHAAIVIGEQIVWETQVSIPQRARVLDLEWRTSQDIHAGDPIRFHLHNHGQNFWALAPIMAELPAPDR